MTVLGSNEVARSGGEATVADVLNRAADLIEERGWWNGDGPHSYRRGECAGTATKEAACGDLVRWTEATRELQRHLGIHRGYVPKWNDRQPDGQTVVAALRAAALIASTTAASAAPERALEAHEVELFGSNEVRSEGGS